MSEYTGERETIKLLLAASNVKVIILEYYSCIEMGPFPSSMSLDSSGGGGMLGYYTKILFVQNFGHPLPARDHVKGIRIINVLIWGSMCRLTMV